MIIAMVAPVSLFGMVRDSWMTPPRVLEKNPVSNLASNWNLIDCSVTHGLVSPLVVRIVGEGAL